jgi:hypothetical protein
MEPCNAGKGRTNRPLHSSGRSERRFERINVPL